MLTIALLTQLAIVARAPDSVFACDTVPITVTVRLGGRIAPDLTVPPLGPFDVLRAGLPMMQRIGRDGLTAEYRMVVTTDRVGRMTIPPFVARVGRDRVASQSLVIDVRPPRRMAAPTIVARARIDTSVDLSLGSTFPVDTVFVGQQATYEVAVFLNRTARDRMRRNPTFYPPDMQAVLAYDLAPTSSSARRRAGSRCFDALVYRRALFPLVRGRLVIPPAQLVYYTGLPSATLFSREESHELQTDSVAIVAIDPPADGRPSEFSGAVGRIEIDARVDSNVFRIGDPALLTVSVSGTGNVKLFPRPEVRAAWASLVPADERVRIDTGEVQIGGTKEFDWVLTPHVAGEFDLPPIEYGYFDPSRQRYHVAEFTGRRLRVAGGSRAPSDTAHASGLLSIRTRYRGEAWAPPQSRGAFWLLLALVPLPAIASRVRRRKQTLVPTAVDPMRALTSVAMASDPVALRRLFVRALAQRLACSAEHFTHPGALERALRRAGVSDTTAGSAERLLRELDVAAYTRATAPPTDAARRAADIARSVDAEALGRRELPFWIPALVVALVASGSVAMATDTTAVHFARGVSEYLRGEADAARISFGHAVTLAPRSEDAWANYATAAWAESDTAAAVFGWRQTLALDPTASDAQERISLVRSEGVAAPGWVPELPSHSGPWLFALLWVVAWLAAWNAERYPDARRVVLPLIVSAVLVAVIAVELEERIAGGRLAVVRRAQALSFDPALGMDRGRAVGTGQIVRVAARRGGWVRIEASGDRIGWLPSQELYFVAERRVPHD